MGNPKPGWYDDGNDATRWWDGKAWTSKTITSAAELARQIETLSERIAALAFDVEIAKAENVPNQTDLVATLNAARGGQQQATAQLKLLNQATPDNPQTEFLTNAIAATLATAVAKCDNATALLNGESVSSLEMSNSRVDVTAAEQLPAGWYDDGNGVTRWWDGQGWTERTKESLSAKGLLNSLAGRAEQGIRGAVQQAAAAREAEKENARKRQELARQHQAYLQVHGVKVPAEYDELTGKDYRAVVSEFEIAGFTNIETIPLRDLIVGLSVDVWNPASGVRNKVGVVEEVSVGGNSSFSANTWCVKDVKVKIRYHSYRSGKTERSIIPQITVKTPILIPTPVVLPTAEQYPVVRPQPELPAAQPVPAPASAASAAPATPVAPTAPVAPATPVEPVAPAASTQPPTIAERIASLAQLRDHGIITDAEFTAGKAKILGL